MVKIFALLFFALIFQYFLLLYACASCLAAILTRTFLLGHTLRSFLLTRKNKGVIDRRGVPHYGLAA
jgi:hypothetical protein